MNKKFSTSWKLSKQPRKQRKYRANAPLHLKKKFVKTNLSKDLRKKIGKRNIQIKKGDIVKIMRGKFKGKTGKVLNVLLKESKVNVEGAQVTKLDGSKANIKINPSNLQIKELTERKNIKTIKKSETISKEKPKEKKTEIKEKKGSKK